MKTVVAAMTGLLCFTGMVAAQAPRQGPPPMMSPEILPDGRVTFRLLAPEATSASVTGDWPGGIESTTTPITEVVKQVLKDKGLKYTLMEFPGYIHEWPVWRVTLKDLLPRLFQPASK